MTARWTPDQIPDLTGRRALVTGANSGIGAVEARELARHGADVVLAVRNTDAGEAAAERIRATGVPGNLSVERLDLASQESVRALAARFEGPLDLLVNNAGIMAPPKHRETGDGFEMQFGTNHLGHFALTGLLLPHLLEAEAPRVTTVSSIAHHRGDGRVAEGNPAAGLRPEGQLRALQARQPAVRPRAAAPRRAPRAHDSPPRQRTPGCPRPTSSPTRRVRDRSRSSARISSWAVKLAFPSPDRGAEAILFAATAAEPGSYSGPTSFGETRGAVGTAKQSHWAQDEALAALLWERSEELTGVHYSF